MFLKPISKVAEILIIAHSLVQDDEFLFSGQINQNSKAIPRKARRKHESFLFFAGLQYAANVILTVQKLGFVLAIMELAPVCNCVNPVRARSNNNEYNRLSVIFVIIPPPRVNRYRRPVLIKNQDAG